MSATTECPGCRGDGTTSFSLDVADWNVCPECDGLGEIVRRCACGAVLEAEHELDDGQCESCFNRADVDPRTVHDTIPSPAPDGCEVA